MGPAFMGSMATHFRKGSSEEGTLMPRSKVTRRSFLRAASRAAILHLPLRIGMMTAAPKRQSTDIRVKELHISYEHFPYRTAYEFGGRSADRKKTKRRPFSR